MSKQKSVGSNWSKLKSKVVGTKPVVNKESEETVAPEKKTAVVNEKTKALYVGLDCEMVGIGPNGTQSALARCCMVDFDGNVIYDEFVRPPGFVTDFRTKYSGVRKKDLRQGTAISLLECQTAVANILKDKVLVGHALKNDLDVLMLSHPRTMIRDTARYRPYMRIHGKHGKVRPRALRDLTKEHLNLEIQTGEHDPGVDARCAVMLYRKARDEWEQQLKDLKLAAKMRAEASHVTAKEEQKVKKELQKKERENKRKNSTEEENVPTPVVQAKELIVLRSEDKGKRKRSTTTSNVDVEVQVFGGDDDHKEEEDAEEMDENLDGEVATTATGGSTGAKKRKISKRSGLISSRSSRNFQNVADKLDAAKRARAEVLPRGNTENYGGMFGASNKNFFGLEGTAKSISEVDRAMKRKRKCRINIV